MLTEFSVISFFCLVLSPTTDHAEAAVCVKCSAGRKTGRHRVFTGHTKGTQSRNVFPARHSDYHKKPYHTDNTVFHMPSIIPCLTNRTAEGLSSRRQYLMVSYTLNCVPVSYGAGKFLLLNPLAKMCLCAHYLHAFAQSTIS